MTPRTMILVGIDQPTKIASGIAVAYTRTLSASERTTRKTPEATRLVWGPKRDSSLAYAVSCCPRKYPGSSHAATATRPRMYPSGSCRKARLVRAPRPGIEITVIADVSVATIENITAHQG